MFERPTMRSRTRNCRLCTVGREGAKLAVAVAHDAHGEAFVPTDEAKLVAVEQELARLRVS